VQRILTFILAGGRGERLQPLTRDRAKPAVPFGGIYRVIDFTLSNCLHSQLRRVFVLTQYKSLSLERHIRLGWNIFTPAVGEFITSLPPQQRIHDQWYQGTADAVYQNWYSIEQYRTWHGAPEAILVLAGDHVYKMDYQRMAAFHRERGADVTVGVVRVPRDRARGTFGVLVAGDDGRVRDFEEKPEDPSPAPGAPDDCLASMGIYIFETNALRSRLEEDAQDPDSSHDFGRDVITRMAAEDRVYAFPLERGNRNPVPYWCDVGTLDAYWEAHMDLVDVTPRFNLYDRDWPIHTFKEPWPPSKTVHAEAGRTGAVLNSLISPGCIISGGQVVRSVLSPGVHVHSYAHVEDSIILDAVEIGRGAVVRRAILDKSVRVRENARIGVDPSDDAARFPISERGIVAVPRGTDVLGGGSSGGG